MMAVLWFSFGKWELPNESKGYRMGKIGNKDIKRMHSLFVDDLKVYQDGHRTQEVVNASIV